MAVELLGGAEQTGVRPGGAPITQAAERPPAEREALIAADPDLQGDRVPVRGGEPGRDFGGAAPQRARADTVDGVKRQVRPGMGRCRGASAARWWQNLLPGKRAFP